MSIVDLAARQLAAYNAADLESRALLPRGRGAAETRVLCGRDALRDRYRPMFEGMEFGASVPDRLHRCPLRGSGALLACEPGLGERTEGTVLVRYTERDGLIGRVQFLR